MNRMEDMAKILISEEELDKISTRVAKEISRDYAGKKLLLVGILKGAILFMADLMKKLDIPAQIDFMKVSSYGAGTVSSGQIKITLDLNRPDIAETDILIIEDIVDSGRTLNTLTALLRERGAKSVRTCSLLDKPSRREVDFTPDYIGKEIPDEFVIGYGLDYDEDYRTLPFIGVLKPSIYEK